MNLHLNKPFAVLIKILLWGLGLAFGTLLGAALTLIFVLLSGPLDLKNYRSYIEHGMHSFLPKTQLEFDSATLKWDSEFWSLILTAEKVKFSSPENQNKYKAEGITLRWPVLRVLAFHFLPNEATLHKPRVKVTESEEETQPLEEDSESLFESLQQLIHQTSLERLVITEASFNFNFAKYGLWKATEADIVFKKAGKEIEGAFVVTVEGLGRLTGDLLTRDKKARKLELGFKNLNPQAIFTHSHFKDSLALKDYKDHFLGINIPFSGVITIYLDENLTIEGGKFNLEGGSGFLAYPSYFPQAIPLQTAFFKGECVKGKLTLQNIKMISPRFTTEIEGTIDFLPSLQDIQSLQFSLKNTSSNLKFQDASLLWPKQLGGTTREWILKNILVGDVPKATATIEGNYDCGTQKADITKLSGTLTPRNATLKYLTGLPEIKGVNADAWYDKETMTITIAAGQTYAQHIQSGKIIISDLHKEDQLIDIDLQIEGAAQDALKIINVPRLKYADKYGLKPGKIKGVSASRLHFKFPLELKTTLDKVEIAVESTLKSLTIPQVLETPSITLSEATLNLNLKKEEMIIEGKGLLNEAEAHILMHEKFENTKDWLTKLKVSSTLSEKQLKMMGFSLGNYFKGKAPITLELTNFEGKRGDLTAQVDLKDTTLFIPEFKVFSDGGKGQMLTFALSMKNGLPVRLKRFKIDAKDKLQFDCSADFLEKSVALKELLIKNFKTATDSYTGQVNLTKEGIYRISLAGSYIDLNSFIENREEIEDSFLSHVPYSANIRFQKAEVKTKPFLKNMVAELTQSATGVMENLHLSAELDNTSPQKQNCIIKIATQGKEQTLTLRIDDLGTALTALNAGSDLRGGITEVKAKRVASFPPSAWEGDYKIKDFQVIKAPLLAQLLKIANPLAFVDIFTKGEGLKFADLKGNFILKPDLLTIKKSFATSPSLGMTIEGVVNRKQETLNLKGTIIPAYILNSMLSYIPIIGQLLTGGLGEGVFAISFTMKGPQSNPQIQANPLSAVTPGFLRKLFESGPIEK